MLSIFDDFKMEMGTGAVAAGAHITNHLTLFHIGTGAYS